MTSQDLHIFLALLAVVLVTVATVQTWRGPR